MMQPQSDALEIGTAYHLMLELYHDGKTENEILDTVSKTTTSISREDLLSMLNKYKENPVDGKILRKEEYFKLDIGIVVTGKIDREDEDKTIDYKTTSVDYKEENCRDTQSRLYTYYRWKRDGKIFPFVYSVLNKKKVKSIKYKPQKITIQYKEYDINSIPKEFNEVNDKILNKEFEPIKGPKCFMCPYGRKYGCNICPHSL